MSTLTLRQVPESLMGRLRAEARRQRRTVSQQAILLLEQALGDRPSFGAALARFIEREGPPDRLPRELPTPRAASSKRR